MKARSTRRARPADLLEDALRRRSPVRGGGEAEGSPLPAGEAEIGDLAGLAAELRRLAPPPPGAAARHRVWAQLLPLLREHRISRARVGHPGAPIRPRAWRPALALIGLLTALGLVGVSAGAAFASEEALPGDPLYPLKRGIEQARIALSWTNQGDAALLLEFADERLQEAEASARAGNDTALTDALRGYDEALGQVMDLVDVLPVEDGEGSIAGLEDHLSRHLEVLARVQGQVPPHAAEAIGAAIERAGQRQEEAERIRGGGAGPDDTPPGQVGRTPRPPKDDHPGPDRQEHPGNGNRGQGSGNENRGQGPPETPGSP